MTRPDHSYDLKRLRAALKPFRLHWSPTLRSTNDHAAEVRRRGELYAPAVVLTGRQTAGRGRGAHVWWSGPGCITVTFVLPVPPVVEEVKAGWDPAADADAATGTLIKMGQRGVSFAIWVGIVGVPIAIGLGLLLGFAFLAWRLGRRVGPNPTEP